MQSTSLAVYHEKVLPYLGQKQAVVLNLFLDTYPSTWTNQEIAKGLGGWCISRVTPRVFELREQGLLELSEKRPCSVTNNKAMAWKLVLGGELQDAIDLVVKKREKQRRKVAKVALTSLEALLDGVEDWKKWRASFHLYEDGTLRILTYIPRTLFYDINLHLRRRRYVYDRSLQQFTKLHVQNRPRHIYFGSADLSSSFTVRNLGSASLSSSITIGETFEPFTEI